VPTEETHRATTFEIFFDLVFVFALTRIISFMAQSLTPLILAQGLVLLLLLWVPSAPSPGWATWPGPMWA
jgi:low temperature requirement protein LtrA